MSPKAENRSRTKLLLAGLVLFLAGLSGWILLLLFGSDESRVWRALLINFLYFTPLATGLVTWSAIVIASKGHWAGEAERLTWTGFGFIIPSLLILVVLWIGSPQWAPWYGIETSQGFWLNNTFLFIRDLIALLVFWACAVWYFLRRRTGRDNAMLPAAILIVLYSIVFSLIGFDLAMALNPAWSSAIFGGYFFISGLYNAIVFWAFLAVIHTPGRPQVESEVRSDFGKLIITFSILTTYFFYMQLLTIWYENLPRETTFVVTRMNDAGWNTVSLALIVVLYLAPVVLLLTTWAKRNRVWLGAVALLLLIGIWVQRWWLVMPGLLPDIQFGWAEISGTAAVLGLIGIGADMAWRHLPLVPSDEEKGS